MKLRFVAYGIAREILGTRSTELELDVATVGQLRAELTDRFPGLSGLRSVSFAINESYQEDTFPLSEGMEVVIIPPVSGG